MPDIFDRYHIPLDGWIQTALDYLVQEHRSTFYAVREPIGAILDTFRWTVGYRRHWIIWYRNTARHSMRFVSRSVQFWTR